ncbi:hypothetical protein ALC57_04691 [Trachymyrmex cornetzi]|uniref:Uncharacterized protein n=1 Tax=Trachymyrmex cornetzi TaxID=471704 RepID=A0A195ECG4_9HYME|nr:hypothetical protein ALC57_04691 [Trachymyrmex cornetzi]
MYKNCRVTSIAMLQTLSHFFAAKCPEGWRGAEVCYRAQRRRIEEKCTDTVVDSPLKYQQGTALKYGSRGLVNSVLGFHVVRRGFSAPWGNFTCSKNHRYEIYSVEERKNGQKKERGKVLRKRQRRQKERKRERLSVIVRGKEARNRKKRAPKPLRSGSACWTAMRPTSSRRLEIAAKWKALAKRYRVGANTKGKPFGTPARPKLNEIIKLHETHTIAVFEEHFCPEQSMNLSSDCRNNGDQKYLTEEIYPARSSNQKAESQRDPLQDIT